MTDRELMQMALEALEGQFYTDGRVIKALRERLSQPEPEPVAWMFQHKETGNLTFFDNLTMAKLFGESNVRWGGAIPLYTAPPKREWKGLTSDDKHFLLANAWNKEQAFDGFMEAIDKFLEEKNT